MDLTALFFISKNPLFRGKAEGKQYFAHFVTPPYVMYLIYLIFDALVGTLLYVWLRSTLLAFLGVCVVMGFLRHCTISLPF